MHSYDEKPLVAVEYTLSPKEYKQAHKEILRAFWFSPVIMGLMLFFGVIVFAMNYQDLVEVSYSLFSAVLAVIILGLLIHGVNSSRMKKFLSLTKWDDENIFNLQFCKSYLRIITPRGNGVTRYAWFAPRIQNLPSYYLVNLLFRKGSFIIPKRVLSVKDADRINEILKTSNAKT